MDIDGRNLQKLTNTGSDYYPSWSPDGERITFMSYRDGNSEIYVMEADGRNPQNLTNVCFGEDIAPAWFHPNLAIIPAAVAPTGKKLSMWGWFKRINQ